MSLPPPSAVFNPASTALSKREAPGFEAHIDFDRRMQKWDGFGVNYVETAQTRDYDANPQDYGGFSVLSEDDRRKVIDLTFGDDGLRPGLVKMFLDPFHQPRRPADAELDNPIIDPAQYDHDRTTGWMRQFVCQGHQLTRRRGDDLEIILTIYGPPAWMTLQQQVRARDLDPACKTALAKYMVAWAQHLRQVEGLPLKWVSLHNEGEDWRRWPADGSDDSTRHDYNLFWPTELVCQMLPLTRRVLDANGLQDVGVTCGETSNWVRFHQWGYADALADDPQALAAMGLVTSHGFYARADQPSRWTGDWRSAGLDILRARRPELHAWVTSTSWSKMNANFVWEAMQSIYSAKVNGIIPWASIQRSALWAGGDPNPGTAFRVSDDGKLTVEQGYHYFKHLSRAGQAGMHVCRALVNDTDSGAIAFVDAWGGKPASVVLINRALQPRDVQVRLGAAPSRRWTLYRTSPGHWYENLGVQTLSDNGRLTVHLPEDSVATLEQTSD